MTRNVYRIGRAPSRKKRRHRTGTPHNPSQLAPRPAPTPGPEMWDSESGSLTEAPPETQSKIIKEQFEAGGLTPPAEESALEPVKESASGPVEETPELPKPKRRRKSRKKSEPAKAEKAPAADE